MSSTVEPHPASGSYTQPRIPTIRTSEHEDLTSTSSITSANSRGLQRNESSGLLSSLMSVAHNAANMMKSKHGESVENLVESKSGSFEEKRKHHMRLPSHSAQSQKSSSEESSSQSRTETPDNASLTPSNVHFDPIRNSPIHTLGEGDLSLVHFGDNKPASKQISDSAQVPVKGGPFTTESASNKLLVMGTSDSKIVRRKSISTSSIADSISSEGTIDTDGADSHSYNPSEFSNLELDELLETTSQSTIHPKRDKEFHNTFKRIPSNEHALADFSCALSRDILVQGKMYLSARYICFNSNILGWVTNLVIPIQEIIQIEKKSTAVLFPNGIVIRTLHQKYVFATFLSRDSTFNVITQVWHNALQDNDPANSLKPKKSNQRRASLRRSTTGSRITQNLDSDDSLSGYDNEHDSIHSNDDPNLTFNSHSSETKDKRSKKGSFPSESGSESDADAASIELSNESHSSSEPKSRKSFKGIFNPGPQSHAPTSFEHDKVEGEVEILKHTFNAPLGVVYSLLCGSDNSAFVRILEEGKNFDISKEKITGLDSQHTTREYSYTKPLNGPIGPKQTKCNITETVRKYELSNYCELEQITKTPDVPSGNSFKVKTRFYFSWGPKNSTNLSVYTIVEWSAKSWIKSAIEKGSLDGQKSFMKTLTDTVTDIISQGGAGTAKKRRRTTKSGSQSNVKEAETTQPPAAPKTLLTQILDLVDHVGSSLPIQIPMVSDTISGCIVFFVVSLLYSYILMRLMGGGSAISRDQISSKMFLSGDGRYVMMPSSDYYIGDEYLRRQSEAQLWDWVATRTGAQASGSQKKAVHEKYDDEDFKELMRMTKKRLDAVYSIL